MKHKFSLLLYLIYSAAFGQVDYSQYQGHSSSVIFSYQFPLSNLYDYSVDAVGDSLLTQMLQTRSPEQALLSDYQNDLLRNTADSVVFALLLQSRLIIDINRERHVLIKYKEVKNGQKALGFKIIDLAYQGGSWIKNPLSRSEIDTLKSIMLMSSVELLFKLFGETDQSSPPIINKLRPIVKNEKGHLDIEKLQTVLSENQSQLSNFID